MAADSTAVEQAVSRALRDNLEKIQRNADELHQAVSDLVAACASSRPSNALPSMVRAQTSAASISAALEVLSRFVTGALQPAVRMPFEPEILRVPSMGAAPVAVAEQPAPMLPHPTLEKSWTAPGPVEAPVVSEVPPAVQTPVAMEMPPTVEPAPPLEPVLMNDPVLASLHEPEPQIEPVLAVETHVESEPAEPVFNLDALPQEEQELHRRAWRVAKVSMQDIKMLRPEEVRVGRENKDLCIRLRDDIEKAHKEYDRRFQSIQSHPVDYFYDWMVEILAGGDPQALGEYPYPSPVLHH
jgi:hypothetical protein